MDGVGGLAGWRWIFILEGIATVLAGFIATLILPTDISSAKFLTEAEKQFARTSDFFFSGSTYHQTSSLTVHRFRKADSPASNVPLSEAARKITDSEKATVQQVEKTKHAVRSSQEIVYQEDEVFEWREVVRGTFKNVIIVRSYLILL